MDKQNGINREELKKRMFDLGATSSQVKSQTVDFVLAALANDDAAMLEKEALTKLKSEFKEYRRRAQSHVARLWDWAKRLEEKEKEIEERERRLNNR